MNKFTVNTNVTFVDERYINYKDLSNENKIIDVNSLKYKSLFTSSSILIFRPSSLAISSFRHLEKYSRGIVLKSKY